MDNGDDVRKLGLKDRVKVGRAGDGGQTVSASSASLGLWFLCDGEGGGPDVRVGELGEDTDVGRVLELGTWDHERLVPLPAAQGTHGQPW